jgi:hypothetical protein
MSAQGNPAGEGGGRALVALVRPDASEPAPPQSQQRADASFLAHLLATRAGLPQQRMKRRAEPGDGAAAYGTVVSGIAAGRPAIRPGKLDVSA